MTEFLIVILIICVAAILLVPIISIISDSCKTKDIEYDSDDSAIDIKLDEPEDSRDEEITDIIEKICNKNKQIGEKKKKGGAKIYLHISIWLSMRIQLQREW